MERQRTVLAREHSWEACVVSPSLTHLVEAQPRWELGWPSNRHHAPSPPPPPFISPLSFNSHRPFSRVSNVKPVSGSQGLLPMFSCPRDSIVPSASDAVTLLVLPEGTPTTFLVPVMLSSFCRSVWAFAVAQSSSSSWLTSSELGEPGQPRAACTEPGIGPSEPPARHRERVELPSR